MVPSCCLFSKCEELVVTVQMTYGVSKAIVARCDLGCVQALESSPSQQHYHKYTNSLPGSISHVLPATQTWCGRTCLGDGPGESLRRIALTERKPLQKL